MTFEFQQTVARADILEYIGFSYYTKGDIKQALKYTNELLAVQPDHARAVGNKVYYEDALKKAEDSKQKKGDDGQDEIVADPEYTVTEMDKADSEHAIYQKLCRGETVKPLL
jgi:prolyl 4-hydroxylase